jgi:predicted HTH transcriptional regulator
LIRPQFIVKAVYWEDENNFKDKEEIMGNLIEQFKKSMDFLRRNLRKIQRGNVNAPSTMEIPEEALMEAVANAIVHRDYFIESPIYIEIWDNRVEVRSPGKLPNTLTIEEIKSGIHNERNPIILSFLEKDKDFRYSGMGRGIPRIISKCAELGVEVDFINDIERLEFKVIFKRPLG